MSTKSTCGIYIISRHNRILICHPTGGRKWSISKGKPEEGENAFETAVRETMEETGICIDLIRFGIPIVLPDRKYRNGRKILKSFVVCERGDSADHIEDFACFCDSMTIRNYPEMDDYEWVTLDRAKKKLHESQVKNLDIIRKML